MSPLEDADTSQMTDVGGELDDNSLMSPHDADISETSGLMMHDAGVGLRLRRLSEAGSESRPDPCVPGASLTGAVSPCLTSSPSASSSSPDLGVTSVQRQRPLDRQRTDLSPVGASLQEMYGLVSNRAKDPNEKVNMDFRFHLSIYDIFNIFLSRRVF